MMLGERVNIARWDNSLGNIPRTRFGPGCDQNNFSSACDDASGVAASEVFHSYPRNIEPNMRAKVQKRSRRVCRDGGRRLTFRAIHRPGSAVSRHSRERNRSDGRVRNAKTHTTWNREYHVVFVPKFRRNVLYHALREAVREVFRQVIPRLDDWIQSSP
jgi:hypothetical protein